MTVARSSRALVAAGALGVGAAFVGLRVPSQTRVVALDPAQFVAEAAAATFRYDSLQHAVDDGFTRVGTEFPAMGEHWVSFARVMEDTLDARRPSVLIYVNTVDGPRLAGVAYSRLIASGATPPAFPFVGAWHEHNGAVSEESLPSGHGTHAPASLDATPLPVDSLRFFILHAWVPTANPAGPFATENWTLPLLRLGLDPRTPLPHDAIRGLALGADDQDYHREMLSTALSLTARDDSVVTDIVGARRARIGGALGLIRRERAVSPGHSAMLATEWDSLWLDLERALPSRKAELRGLRARM